MKYTVYRITNQINGKIYVGCHKTSDLDDGYMGSGKILIRAIEKYGVENFTKEYLAVFDNSAEMFDMEAQLVNEEFVKRHDTYNLKEGGLGGFEYINNSNLNGTNAGVQRRLELLEDEEWREFMLEQQKKGRENMSAETKQKAAKKRTAAIRERFGDEAFKTFLGKTHSDEAKAKIGSANSKLQRGEGNSQFGSMWITNGIESKKVKKTDTIPEGWKKGRKIIEE